MQSSISAAQSKAYAITYLYTLNICVYLKIWLISIKYSVIAHMYCGETYYSLWISWSKITLFIHSFLSPTSCNLCFLKQNLLSIAFWGVAIFLLTSSFRHQDEIRYLSKYILANFEDLPSLWCVSNQKVNWHAMWICSDTNFDLFGFGIVPYIDWKCRSNIVLLLHNASVWSRSLEHYECLVWSHR